MHFKLETIIFTFQKPDELFFLVNNYAFILVLAHPFIVSQLLRDKI